jgi:hypothetical protein
MGLKHHPRVVTDGLVMYLDAANTRSYSGSGNTANGLIGGIGGTLVNGVGFGSTNNGSFIFDGTNDYIDIPSTTLLNSTTFSLSFWINNNAFNGLYVTGAVSNGLYTLFGTGSNYQGFTNTFSGAIQIGLNSNSVATVNESNFLLNNWYHYVAVYDGSGVGNSGKFKIFINAVQKTLTYDALMPSTPYNSGFTTKLGYAPGSGYPYFNGNISQVQLYNRALTQQEISQNYNATKMRYL